MQNLTAIEQDGTMPLASIRLGDFSSTVAGAGARLLRSGTQTCPYRLYSDDAGAVLYGSGSVPDIRGALSRTLLTTDHTGGDVRVHALMGQIKAYNAKWNDEVVSAVHGRIELVRASGTQTLGGNGLTAPLLGVISNSGAYTVDTNHVLAGCAVYSDFDSNLTQTGSVVGFYVGLYDHTNWSDTSRTRVAFGHGIKFGDGAVTTGVTFGTCTTAISIAGAVTTGISISGNATDGIKISGGTVVDAIEIGASTNAINVSGAVTKGLYIAGNATDGVYIGGGTVVDAIEVGACTNGLNISGAVTKGVVVAGNATTGIDLEGTMTTGIKITGAAQAILAGASTASPITTTSTGTTNIIEVNAKLNAASGTLRGVLSYCEFSGTHVSTTMNTYAIRGYAKMSGTAGEGNTNYTCGVQGKIELSGTVSGGKHAAVLAQLNSSAGLAAATGGTVYCLWADGMQIGENPASAVNMVGIGIELPDAAARFDSAVYVYGGATYLFDLSNSTVGSGYGANKATAPAAATGTLKIRLDGDDYYILITDDPTA